MDATGGFFFSFDAPGSRTTTANDGRSEVSAGGEAALSSMANAAPAWPPATIPASRFPWVKVDVDAVSAWAAACSGASATTTKPLQLSLHVPPAALPAPPPSAALSPSPSAHVTASATAAQETRTLTLCYQTSPEVSGLTAVAGDATKAANAEHRDVIPGRYYGGLKVWSCATLLAEYLAEEAAHYAPLFRAAGVVVELGCGQALPGLAALCLGARRVVFQDYNAEVLEVCTKPNLAATVRANSLAPAIVDGKSAVPAAEVKFIHGDWVDLQWDVAAGDTRICDVLLGADVTFDKEACDKLACVLQRWLTPRTGEALIVSKDYYFGTNGGVLEFSRSAEACGLCVAPVKRVDTADKMPHVVLRVTRRG